MCLPTNVLGKEYYSSSFTQNSNENNSNSYITIVGVEDNTSVEIVPAATTVGGWAANSINTVTINKGQVYQVLGTTTGNTGVDLSGTKVRSIASGSGGCKKIAVFSGTGKISIGSPGCTGSSADNLYQQLYPVSSWGKYFLTVPSSGRPNNHYRIYRNNAAANIYLNGTLIPSASFTNNYYQFYNNTPNSISSDLPISLAQYFTSQNCPTPQNPYDPDMIMLSPVEQNISKVTLVSSPPQLPNLQLLII
ncbi:MAG: IgGFc-binding protein [Chitinophagaceae bacterium]|nr:IgGFc-binding protein [Chitinophagaceae bacterium]